MCLAKGPKVVQASAASDKPVPVLRNPYLDGIDPIIRARSMGTRSMRIDRGSASTARTGPSYKIAPKGVPAASAAPRSFGESLRHALGKAVEMKSKNSAATKQAFGNVVRGGALGLAMTATQIKRAQ